MYKVIFPQKIDILLSFITRVLGKGWGCRKPGGNSGKFIVQSAIWCCNLHKKVLTFWYICSNLRLFIPFQGFSGKISSELERFRASRYQRFSSPPTMVRSGSRPFRQSLHPWTWSLPCASQIQILQRPLKV